MIKKDLEQLLGFEVEATENSDFGDYSSNIALSQKSPREFAEKLVSKLAVDSSLTSVVSKIEVAGPGFINFWLKPDVLLNNLIQIDEEKEKYGSSDLMKGKKVLIEHTSPNPQTTIMLGHLRNNFLGMSVANILSFLGAKVTRDCIVNDRGVHICRSIWGYLVFANKKSGLDINELKNFRQVTEDRISQMIKNKNWHDLLGEWVKDCTNWVRPEDLDLKPDHANLIWYVLGSTAFKMDEDVYRQVKEILTAWEDGNADVWEIWKQILSWSNEGYQETYRRVDSVHDWVWYESELYKVGKELVEEGLEKGVFQRSKGAIVSNLQKFNLPDLVAIKSDGAATYLVFDINLTKQKTLKFPSDKYIWTIGEEQSLYFKQLFTIAEQLGIGRKENFYHLSYALINFKGAGKMSTRKGNVVMADEVLDELEVKVRKLQDKSNKELRKKLTKNKEKDLIKQLAVGSIKYSFLRCARNSTIFYDVDESISLEGNSGPYIQYTVARANSVLSKVENWKIDNSMKIVNCKLEIEEQTVLRSLIRFPEIIETAAINYSPNLVCNYLYDLAQKYNSFYNKCSILTNSDELTTNFRLALTSGVGQVLKNGLKLLGIESPERM